MGFSGKQKKYLKKHLKKESVGRIADHLGITEKEIHQYLEKRWGREKYEKFFQKRTSGFNFKTWAKQRKIPLLILAFLVFITYVNSLGNEFVSDDVATILTNESLGKFSQVFANFPVFIRPLIFFFIKNIFGLTPAFYRLVNIIFHFGSVLAVFLLAELLIGTTTAFLTALILAVHPIEIESVVWISGGPYSQYSFFMLLGLIAYILAKKHRKYYYFSILSFVLALLSMEKAMVFPFILLALVLAFGNFKKEWKKLIPFFAIGFFWIMHHILKIPGRLEALQPGTVKNIGSLNPILQVPVAIANYLKLIFWPKDLTLYQSEMTFSSNQYLVFLFIFLTVIGLIIYGFFKNRQMFFWLSLFIISLLPTLTPFGVSWIVAERYVYLGSIGIFVCFAMLVNHLSKVKKLKRPVYFFFSLLITALFLRTIRRNIDWKNQDNLWLSAAKISPSSSQNHNNLGDLYGRRGDYKKAEEHFKTAIELKPGYADAYHNLANIYQHMEKFDLAIENYQQAIKFNPNLWQSHQALGLIFLNQKKEEEAKNELEIVLKINPQNQQIKSLLLQLSTE